MDDLQTTGVSAGEGSAATGTGTADLTVSPNGDVTPASTTDAGQPTDVAAVSDTGAADLAQIIEAIPADDTDLAAQATQPHYQALVQQRSQLRSLSSALRELEPLREYGELGPVAAIKSKVELANKLYSPLTNAQGQTMIDPTTQTPYVTTYPFIAHLDQNSPGMPEQLLADLLDYEVAVDERGTKRKLSLQVLDYWDSRFPQWWKNRYGAQIAPVTGAVTPEELAEIPSEYHEAYRLIPPSIRHAWTAYDEADRTRMLEDYKGKVDDAARRTADAERAREQEAADNLARQQYIATKQREYLATVRQERYNTLSATLAKQVVFSDDQATNSIMHGALGAVLANLTDPDVDFIAKEQVLKPLGVQLDQKFYAALNRYYTNAQAKVAYEVAGDAVQASTAETEAMAAADQLNARLAIIALQIAEKMGAQRAKAAATVGAALGSAATVRPTPGTGTAPQQTPGVLPANMRPGSPEALAEIARQTGFVV